MGNIEDFGTSILFIHFRLLAIVANAGIILRNDFLMYSGSNGSSKKKIALFVTITNVASIYGEICS
jgi:hypothetical protein